MPEQAELYAYCHGRYIRVEELLEFAVETGKLEPLSLAVEVKSLKHLLYHAPESAVTMEQLCQAEAALEILYTKLARLVAPVTIETLRATSDKYVIHRPWWSAWLLGSFCAGRNLLRQLFWVGLALLLTMLIGKYFKLSITGEMSTQAFLVSGAPFLYGAVGAWIYLYKTLTERYSSRCLNPHEWPNYLLRLFMGALAGGLIVHFMMTESGTSYANELSAIQSNLIETTVLGLLAGYSVDFFYGMLDRLIQAVLPPTPSKDGAGKTPPPTAKQLEMEALLKRLHEASDEQDKTTIRALLEKL